MVAIKILLLGAGPTMNRAGSTMNRQPSKW